MRCLDPPPFLGGEGSRRGRMPLSGATQIGPVAPGLAKSVPSFFLLPLSSAAAAAGSYRMPNGGRCACARVRFSFRPAPPPPPLPGIPSCSPFALLLLPGLDLDSCIAPGRACADTCVCRNFCSNQTPMTPSRTTTQREEDLRGWDATVESAPAGGRAGLPACVRRHSLSKRPSLCVLGGSKQGSSESRTEFSHGGFRRVPQ